MASCLGLYVESNLIKYAKISKDHENVKIDSFGIKFYESFGETLKQIIEETSTYRTPISVNLSEEAYTDFNMFSLLTKKDLQRAIETEFETICSDKGKNPNDYEKRYALVNSTEDKEKIKVIHVNASKMELNKISQNFSKYRLTSVAPISMSIANIAELKPKQNVMIVNIEEKTRITTVIDEKIYDVKVLEEGSKEILEKINIKEGSRSKAYESCKNTTIYTSNAQDLGQDVEGHLEDIMPSLYSIVGQVRKLINESPNKIDTLYITGTIAVINNVDLYFQEYLSEVDCKILKPYFLQNSVKEVNIKDYVEVNSAISLALQGLHEGIEGMNFKKASFSDKLPEWLVAKEKKGDSKNKGITNDLLSELDTVEINLLRSGVGLLLTIIIFSVISILLTRQIRDKQEETDELILDTKTQIASVQSDTQKIKGRTNEYITMRENLENLNDRINDTNRTRNAIPNLLNQIMYAIPENVQITSIQNTTQKHIVINAQAEKYEQLGYLKAKLKADNILLDVISNSGVKEGDLVKVTIEGDLP